LAAILASAHVGQRCWASWAPGLAAILASSLASWALKSKYCTNGVTLSPGAPEALSGGPSVAAVGVASCRSSALERRTEEESLALFLFEIQTFNSSSVLARCFALSCSRSAAALSMSAVHHMCAFLPRSSLRWLISSQARLRSSSCVILASSALSKAVWAASSSLFSLCSMLRAPNSWLSSFRTFALGGGLGGGSASGAPRQRRKFAQHSSSPSLPRWAKR
jgi:hypothetical protein